MWVVFASAQYYIIIKVFLYVLTDITILADTNKKIIIFMACNT